MFAKWRFGIGFFLLLGAGGIFDGVPLWAPIVMVGVGGLLMLSARPNQSEIR